MRRIIFLGLFLITLSVFGQDSIKDVTVNTSFSITTRNIWRGIVYGNNTPTVQGTLGLNYKNKFEVGAFGTATVNGDRKGFGNWIELYSTYTVDHWSLTLDDYYFFSYDSLNDYLNWNRSTTQHLIEAKLKYNIDKKFNIAASYNFFANKYAKKGVYFEAEYFIIPEFSLLFGAVTGASWLNYYNAGGVTTIGVAGTRDIKVTKTFSIPVRTVLIFNPNYKNIAQWDGSGYVNPGYDGLGRNPVNFAITLTF